jgi:hypothetical protein
MQWRHHPVARRPQTNRVYVSSHWTRPVAGGITAAGFFVLQWGNAGDVREEYGVKLQSGWQAGKDGQLKRIPVTPSVRPVRERKGFLVV